MDNNINENGIRNSSQIVLIACGSFNPPTFMHLRMFEIARDYLHRKGETVIGGIISPVHDAYGKKDLEHSSHRIMMLKEALKDSDWIKVSTWESQQEGWSKTRVVVQYHQNHLNAIVNDCSITPTNSVISWVPDTLLNQNQNNKRKIRVKLLCGADLLESFAVPNLWAPEDMECLAGEQGLVVISRCGSNAEKFIYESDILYHYMNNIDLITEWITNELSSTKIRRALRRSQSVKYLIPDAVIDYIYKHNLYGSGVQNMNKYLNPPNINENNMFLTPSPSDISMTPSPLDNNIFITINNANNDLNNYRKMSIDTVDSNNKIHSNKTTTLPPHPGQAVKIITEVNGEHKIIEKVGDDSSNSAQYFVETRNSRNQDKTIVKSAKSCQNFNNTRPKTSHQRIKSSKSNTEISELNKQNGDEPSIKFIFTKEGIQVISDIETAV